ncbi:EAP30/Vps36 family protein [Klebsormidium nitens]|uniref:Vacuolar protein-sorting-associated protein 36 n=1 Tax=Klebsormidium nitens TaxID=105231 RepID=A0A1Y1HLL7_KLENI|nr:EAP30/Vps36 family protein [Klebsormidium nitens]|eukprot:GAQ79510.1 EAP30/Vps36 family protein [Klebsormidium nitens]
MLLLEAQLSESGRPILQPGEIECQLIDSTDIDLEQETKPPYWNPLLGGIVSLTTHRIIWIERTRKKEPVQSRAFAIPHPAVHALEPPKKGGLKSLFGKQAVKLRIVVGIRKDGALATRDAASAVRVVMVFRNLDSNSDAFVTRFQEVLEAKAWTVIPPTSALPGRAHPGSEPSFSGRQDGSQPSRAFTTAHAGVSGILKREEAQAKQADETLQEAFGDLNALMSKAKDMVALAERIRMRLAGSSGGTGGGTDEGEGSRQEMQDLLLSVGIASPVTRENAGALYHQQLSRQLSDFVGPLLVKSNGMMALVDVYCFFNRARGTELISPDDLLQACRLWERVNAPVRLRRFESGVLIVQARGHSDEAIFAQLAQLVKTPDGTHFGISASDAARALGLPPALAKEELLAAEYRGLLCRDDGADGLRFYHNFFLELDSLQEAAAGQQQ